MTDFKLGRQIPDTHPVTLSGRPNEVRAPLLEHGH